MMNTPSSLAMDVLHHVFFVTCAERETRVKFVVQLELEDAGAPPDEQLKLCLDTWYHELY